MLLVQVLHGSADGRPDDATERCREGFHDDDREPGGACGRGDLQAEKAATHDDEPAARHRDGLPQVVRVLERPQRDDTSRSLQPARGGSRRHHESVEGDGRAIPEVHTTPGEVESDGSHTEPKIEAETVYVLRRAELDAVEAPRARQVLLGERGPVVGKVALLPDKYHPAGETVASQLLACPEPGEGRAYDDHGARCRKVGDRSLLR
jgi:hypothetical protein